MATSRNIINFDAIRIDQSMINSDNNIVPTNNALDRAGFGGLPNYRNGEDSTYALEKYKELYLKLQLVKFATEKYINEVTNVISSFNSKVHNEKIVDIIKKYFDSEIEPSSNSASKISLAEIYENIRHWYTNNYNAKPPTSIDVRTYCKNNFTTYDNRTDKISGFKFRNS